jgi:molybdopterin synthase catalytic subunit
VAWRILVQAQDFDVGAELRLLTANRTDVGGVASFIGLVRDMNDGKPLTAMTLEHYPAMAKAQLEALAKDAQQRWPLLAGVIIHRYGRLTPGDQIVLVATASAHRQAAFESAQFLMDWLKTKAPFWKQEESAAGTSWVTCREADATAADKWRV